MWGFWMLRYVHQCWGGWERIEAWWLWIVGSFVCWNSLGNSAGLPLKLSHARLHVSLVDGHLSWHCLSQHYRQLPGVVPTRTQILTKWTSQCNIRVFYYLSTWGLSTNCPYLFPYVAYKDLFSTSKLTRREGGGHRRLRLQWMWSFQIKPYCNMHLTCRSCESCPGPQWEVC